LVIALDKYLDRIKCKLLNKAKVGSSVGIATELGLDGPGSNPGRDEIFRPYRTALGPTQPPVQWVPGLSQGYRRPGRGADPNPI